MYALALSLNEWLGLGPNPMAGNPSKKNYIYTFINTKTTL
jgi:hypothetical protein